MHRDEQSAWQAGSYSSLTPASVEWCNTTAGPLPFLPLLIPSFPISSPFPHLFHSFFLCLLQALPLFIMLVSLFISVLWPLPFSSALVLPLSISFYPEAHVSVLALHTITSIHQLSAYSSLASPLPTLYSITPPLSWLHMFLYDPHFTPTPHTQLPPSGQLSVPPPSLPYGPPSHQMSLKFGWACAFTERAGTKGWWRWWWGHRWVAVIVRGGGWSSGDAEWCPAILPWAFSGWTINTIELPEFSTRTQANPVNSYISVLDCSKRCVKLLYLF